MRKIIATADVAASETPAQAPSCAPTVTLRDEIAMRAMAAIIGGVVSRGGLPALSAILCDDSLLTSSYDFADSAIRVRARQ